MIINKMQFVSLYHLNAIIWTLDLGLSLEKTECFSDYRMIQKMVYTKMDLNVTEMHTNGDSNVTTF